MIANLSTLSLTTEDTSTPTNESLKELKSSGLRASLKLHPSFSTALRIRSLTKF
jgi:hypothetical protein